MPKWPHPDWAARHEMELHGLWNLHAYMECLWWVSCYHHHRSEAGLQSGVRTRNSIVNFLSPIYNIISVERVRDRISDVEGLRVIPEMISFSLHAAPSRTSFVLIYRR